jgi:hypothetical protein
MRLKNYKSEKIWLKIKKKKKEIIDLENEIQKAKEEAILLRWQRIEFTHQRNKKDKIKKHK